MIAFIQDITQNERVIFWLLASSAVFFVVSILGIRWVILNLPSDYFQAKRRNAVFLLKLPGAVRTLIIILKNIAGIAFILLGILLLVLPGQGVLTLLIGIVLTDFPRKYAVTRYLVSRKPVLKGINKLRQRNNKDLMTL